MGLLAVPIQHFLLELLGRAVIVFLEHLIEMSHIRHSNAVADLGNAQILRQQNAFCPFDFSVIHIFSEG